MNPMRRLSPFILIAALALVPPGAGADEHVAPLIVIAQADCKSLSEAVEQVRRQTDGRILSAETKVKGNREVHHIKVLTKDGKVKTQKVQGCKRGG